MPPEKPFGGDAVGLTAVGLPTGVRFTADRANAIGVGTELLAIKVASFLSEPRDRDFRAVVRLVFASPGESVDVPLKRGRYAVGMRFTLLATGQTMALLRLGIIEVG